MAIMLESIKDGSIRLFKDLENVLQDKTFGLAIYLALKNFIDSNGEKYQGEETYVRAKEDFFGTFVKNWNKYAEKHLLYDEWRASDVQTLEINGEICPITFDVDINHEYFLHKEKQECLYTDQDPNFQFCKSSRVTVTLENDDGDKFIASVTDQGLDGMKSKVIWADESNKPDDEIQKEIALKLKAVAYERIWDELSRNIPRSARDFGEKYEWSDEEIEKLIESTELFRDPERNPNNLDGVNTQVHLDLSNLNVVDMTNIAFRRYASIAEQEGQSNVQHAYMVGKTESEINENMSSLPEGQKKAFEKKVLRKIEDAFKTKDDKSEINLKTETLTKQIGQRR